MPPAGEAALPRVGAAPEANLFTVVRRFRVDQETPISAFLKLRPLGARLLLESVEGEEKIARFSFVGLGAYRDLRQEADGSYRSDGAPMPAAGERFLDALRRTAALDRPADPLPEDLPYCGGPVGYLAYDFVRDLERLPGPTADGPRAHFVWPAAVVAFDHARALLTVVCHGRGNDPASARDAAGAAADAIVRALRSPAPRSLSPEAVHPGEARPDMTRDAYTQAVRRAQDHIRRGDAYQVVLSFATRVPWQGDPFTVYRRLRRLNPSPYMFYLEMGERVLVGASPEMLVRVEGRRVTMRPIAGSRPRGADPTQDSALEADLRADPKEGAEHVMLVDLGRNDVGRVARYGSVVVTRYRSVERYSHIMHLVSEVQGDLADGRDALDAVAATFPAGTLTGAPKVRAMEIIADLEAAPRGCYGGAVGYLDLRGNLDTCITIRTLELSGGVATVQAGAGIVLDSDPDREHDECRRKAEAVMEALADRGEEWL
jgi:anthranilate synthase component 1